MTMNLYWRQSKPRTGKGLSDSLKFALRKRFVLSGYVETVLTKESIPYLNGLVDAGIEDASILIDAIKDYDEIEVWEE